ncbi:hypothetical protein ACGFIY_31785 [Micromonospora chersina]|uniref:hypothetical protein n=1 Tax=Micromonospora chersina TaxID=47854 RepID=UPI003717C411
MIHHVPPACPRGSEDTSRAFYAGLLGPVEKAQTAGPRRPRWLLVQRVRRGTAPRRRGRLRVRRFHTYDPHGNRLEFLAPVD